MSRGSLARLVTWAGLVGALSACSAAIDPAKGAGGFADPGQFLADKEDLFTAIVRVDRAENRWTILEDGDHLPVVVSTSEMMEVLSGAPAWKIGELQSVAQYDYSELIWEPLSPPAIEGRRYVLWGAAAPTGGEVALPAPWIAHLQGFLLIRGQAPNEFVYWAQKRYSVADLRKALNAGTRLPLDRIIDPVRRMKVGRQRLEKGNLGDEAAFVEGLLANVRDPEGQAKRVERAVAVDTRAASDDFAEGAKKPHAIWYESLALLRDVGKDERRRRHVVAGLVPFATTGRPQVRLAASLALVDLGSDAGRETLLRAFEKESGEVSKDTDDQMTFPGRYPFDGSSVTASAHALARLGDLRGLNHASSDVRMATAEALKDHLAPAAVEALRSLASEGEREIQKLTANGELTRKRGPGDHSSRLPSHWVRARSLLARSGDDPSLRMLVDAYLVDMATYPKSEAPLVPRGQMMSWGGASIAGGIQGADSDPSRLLARLQVLYGNDPRWSDVALRGLRNALSMPPAQEVKPTPAPAPTEAQIVKLLADPDPNRRAEGLAAAGYHQHMTFYEQVLKTALDGKGVERNAALYALGFYGRAAPEDAMRRLIGDPDFDIRSSAFELATRTNPGRFAPEGLALLRSLIAQKRSGKGDAFAEERSVAYAPRLLCRMARGPIPASLLAGLKDPDPEIRRLLVETLRLGGNPDAVPALEPLLRDPDPAVRDLAGIALRTIGPMSN